MAVTAGTIIYASTLKDIKATAESKTASHCPSRYGRNDGNKNGSDRSNSNASIKESQHVAVAPFLKKRSKPWLF